MFGGVHPPSIDGEQGENRQQKRGRQEKAEVKGHPRLIVEAELNLPEENDRSEGATVPLIKSASR